jgi:hypothetical protein
VSLHLVVCHDGAGPPGRCRPAAPAAASSMLKLLGIAAGASMSPLLLWLVAPALVCLVVFFVLALPLLALACLFGPPGSRQRSSTGTALAVIAFTPRGLARM